MLAINRLQQVVALGTTGAFALFVGIVGHGQQELALDLALGIERHATVFPQLVVGQIDGQIFNRARQFALADGAFAQTHQ